MQWNNHACIQKKQSCMGWGQRHEQGKSTTTDYYLLCTVTYSVCTYQTRRHNIHSKERERPPSKTRAPDRVRRPLWRGAWMTERAPRDRCRLPAPSWYDGGRALSGALLTGAQACAAELAKRRLPSASFVPRPDSPLTASSDASTRTTGPKTP